MLILKILFVAVFIAVNALNPFFVRAQVNGACPKSLALKMICATGYVAEGALAMVLVSNTSKYAWLIMGALFCSWIGDLFLHLWQSRIFPAIGFLGFLSAHFFFIAAFYGSIKSTMPELGVITVYEIIGIVVFDVFFLVFSKKIGTEIKGILKLPILVYASVILTMLLKAVIMGAGLVKTQTAFAVPLLVIAGFGALNFVVSDFLIAILLFNERLKKNYALKMVNMVTYFIAELLLASTILFVK